MDAQALRWADIRICFSVRSGFFWEDREESSSGVGRGQITNLDRFANLLDRFALVRRLMLFFNGRSACSLWVPPVEDLRRGWRGWEPAPSTGAGFSGEGLRTIRW